MKVFALFAFLAFASAEQVNPITKVIQLLSELEAKTLKEGEAEDKIFKEYFEWCDDEARTKKQEIKTASAAKEKQEAKISKATTDIEDASAKIEELAGSISTDEADLKAATEIRKKENDIFVGAEKELMDGVDALGRAIGILERNAKGSALLQSPVDMSNLSAMLQAISTVIDAASLSDPDKEKLLAFVQSQQGNDDVDSELGAPAPDTYKSHSGGILDVLGEMKDKAEEELSNLRKAETTSKHNYDKLKLSLENGLEAYKKEKAENEATKAEAEGTKAAAEGDLAQTNKELAEAQQTLADVSADCMQTAQDHQDSQASRAEELKVLAKAKKIIQSSSGGAASQTYDFLQISSSSRSKSKLRTGTDLRNFEVVKAVQRLASQHHSTALAQLASRIEATIKYGSASGDDPFAKVKGLINEMIEKLMKEAEAEASHKAYCDEEMAKTKQQKDELNEDITKLTSKIDTASARSAQLKEEVALLQKELADLAKLTEEMNKARDEEKALFETESAELQQGITGIQAALQVLREYYEGDAALLQGDDFAAFMQQPAKPAPHEKASGAGGSIISFLEVIESDFSKNLAEKTQVENAAQEEYDKITQENKITKATKEQDVKYKTQEHKGLDKEIAELTGDRDALMTELDAVMEYDEKIKDECIAKPETYEERKKRREAEIAGLKEALGILEGQALFLQHSPNLRGVAVHKLA